MSEISENTALRLGEISHEGKRTAVVISATCIEDCSGANADGNSVASDIFGDFSSSPEGGSERLVTVELLDCSVRDLYEECAKEPADSADSPSAAQFLRSAIENHRTSQSIEVSLSDLLMPVAPSKAICVGLNFAKHIEEMGHERPDVPTLFAKFPGALTAPFSDLSIPADVAAQLDYEGEYAIVIGRPAFRVSEEDATRFIAGEMICNDFTQRDLQYCTEQWMQGKNLQSASGCGPWVTLLDEESPIVSGSEDRILRTWVNGELRQEAPLSDLVFSPAALVAYISRFVQLNPGDVISTGTPAGVGHGKKMYLQPGDSIRIAIDGLGFIENAVSVELAES